MKFIKLYIELYYICVNFSCELEVDDYNVL